MSGKRRPLLKRDITHLSVQVCNVPFLYCLGMSQLKLTKLFPYNPRPTPQVPGKSGKTQLHFHASPRKTAQSAHS